MQKDRKRQIIQQFCYQEREITLQKTDFSYLIAFVFLGVLQRIAVKAVSLSFRVYYICQNW